MNDETEEKIMTEFAALRPKPYNYLINDGDENKKAKGKKKKNHSIKQSLILKIINPLRSNSTWK